MRGVTPLAGAAAGGHDGALLALLRAGASHGPDADGATPVHVASAALHATSVALLLSAGGTAASTTSDGSTPLLSVLLAVRDASARATSEEAREVAVEKATRLAADLLRSAPSAAARRCADGTAPLQVARALAAPRLVELLQDAAAQAVHQAEARPEARQGSRQGGHNEDDCAGGGDGMRYAANYDDDAAASAHAPALEAAAVERGPREAGGGSWVDRV